MDIENLDQEIEWLREDIELDESVMGSSSATGFHVQRLRENKEQLQELLELKRTMEGGMDRKRM